MTKAVVLSNEAQYQIFLENSSDLNDFVIFCDNERFYDFLNERGLKYEILDEFLIKDKWEEINNWGCGRASGWIRQCKERGFFKAFDLYSAIYLYFSVDLILALKNYYYADHLLKKTDLSELVVFESKVPWTYPNLPGNYVLNYWLKKLSQQKNIRTKIFLVDEKRPAPRKSLASIVKGVLQKIYSCVAKPEKNGGVMVYGSLKHLASTLIELKNRSMNVFLYDNEFHFEQFLFALRYHVRYLTPESFSKKIYTDQAKFIKNSMSELTSALIGSEIEDFFVYGSYDFSEFIHEMIIPSMKSYMEELPAKLDHYQNIIDTCQPSGILVEEDFAARAVMAAFMKSKKIPVFCVSHANAVVEIEVSPNEQVFNLSKTFINAEYEKAGYIARGWDPDVFAATGTPRYDRLLQMKRANAGKNGSRKKQILYCAGFLWNFHPDVLGYIGTNIYLCRPFETISIKALLKAIEGLPIEIVIKPAYLADEPLWRELIKELKPQNCVTVAKHSDDFFKLLTESDAMALSYWSTAVIESAMCEIPTVYIDLKSQANKPIREFGEQGFFNIVTDPKTLRDEMEMVCGLKERPKKPKHSNEALEYYLGKRDALGTARVADYILEAVEQNRKSEDRCLEHARS